MSIESGKSANWFNQWEQKGRGSLLFDEPVDIEPAFEPFFFSGIQSSQPVIQEKQVSVIGRLFQSVKKTISTQRTFEQDCLPVKKDPVAFASQAAGKPVCMHIVWPSKDRTVSLPDILSACRYQLSFEIVVINNTVTLQLICDEKDAACLQTQLSSSGFRYIVAEDLLPALLEQTPQITGYGFGDAFIKPINTTFSKEENLLSLVTGVKDATLALQVVFKPVANNWSESILRWAMIRKEEQLFEREPGLAELVKQKTAAPLYAAIIRTIVCSPDASTRNNYARKAEQAVVHLSRSAVNALTPLSDKNYHIVNHSEDVLLRRSHRTGILVNSKELAGFVRIPAKEQPAAGLYVKTDRQNS